MSADITVTTPRRDRAEVPALRVVASTQRGEIGAPLGLTGVVVGTAPDCDLVLDDPRVSRRHCEICLSERGIRIRDMNSKNGTYVRDVPVVEAFLNPGVPVTVGGARLVVKMEGAPATVPLSLAASFGEAIGGGVAMRALFAKLERTAATEETVLLLGESGTGKELLARAIHERSARRGGPFEVFDCTGVSPGLIEAELFGHTRGAFTGAVAPRAGVFEQASGGTLFLDEMGDLPLDLQPKLLRAIETRQVRPVGASAWKAVDVRLVAATHRDLRARVESGEFRADLFYRVAVVEARVPPLRDRKEDIPVLVERFLAAQSPPRSVADLPPNAISMMLSHHWPGNVRELRNTVARLVLFPHLGEAIDSSGPEVPPSPAPPDLCRLQLREARAIVVERFERSYLVAKLREHEGRVPRAAEAMGISRQFLHRLLDQYGIEP